MHTDNGVSLRSRFDSLHQQKEPLSLFEYRKVDNKIPKSPSFITGRLPSPVTICSQMFPFSVTQKMSENNSNCD